MVARIAEEAGVSRKDAESCLNAFTSVVTAALAEKDEIRLIGFGTFTTAVRAARVAKNPRTGEEIKVPETVTPKFKPGQNLKDLVAGK